MGAGPRFIRFFWPTIAALRDLGGSARPREVVDLVLDATGIDEAERAERTKSGSLRVNNQVHWARNYLVWAGLLDGSTRGRWALTSTGWELALEEQDHQTAHELFKRIRLEHSDEWGQSSEATEGADPDEPPAPVTPDEATDVALATALRSTLLDLSSTGFEHLCKRLLTELGLMQLRAVGQAGDRGIDVTGHLPVNAVVTFRVGVQCKQYTGKAVTPKEIREFQGALGPFDRGIFMTTSVFSQQAEEQATAPGYKPIDLIDGERLIELLVEHQLGIKQTTVVETDFFEPFR